MNFSKKYLDIINGDPSGLNLTRITDVEEFHEKQYLDSIMPFRIILAIKPQRKYSS